MSNRYRIKIEDECEDCKGLGNDEDGNTCSACDGEGYLEEHVSLEEFYKILVKVLKQRGVK